MTIEQLISRLKEQDQSATVYFSLVEQYGEYRLFLYESEADKLPNGLVIPLGLE